MVKNKILKSLYSLGLFSVGMVPIVPTLTNNQNSNPTFSSIENKSSLAYNFKPINNFTYIYKNDVNKSVDLKYSNKFEAEKVWNLKKDNIVMYSNYQKANESFFNKYTNLDVASNHTATNFNSMFLDFKEANNSVKFVDNKMSFDFNNKEKASTYAVKLKCGKQHYLGMKVCSNKNHLHNRGCTKPNYASCKGCIDSTENTTWNKSYDSIKMDLVLRSNTIVYDEFDFGRLLNIDENDVVKSFDKSFLKIKFNHMYLKAIMMGSFNYAYATEFFNNNSWMFSNEIKNLLASSILQNKITVFDHYITKYFGFNDQNTPKESNIRYWIENADTINEQKAKEIVDSLEVLDYGKYLERNKLSIKNEFLGQTLYDLFNSNKKQEYGFQIKYSIGGNVHKIIDINLVDLINKKELYLVYNFNENPLSNNVNNQQIKINSIKFVTSMANRNDVEQINLGINFIDKNKKENYIKNYNDSHFTFNKNLMMANLFNINNKSTIENQKVLVDNKIFGLASDNLNDYTFGVLTSFKDYLKPIDNLILRDITNDNYNLLNKTLKPKILNYHMVPDDINGTLEINVNFKDGSSLKYLVDGFEKQKVMNINQQFYDLDLASIGLENFDAINIDYIINNLIGYENITDNNKVFIVDVDKETFKQLFFNNIEIIKVNNNQLKVNLIINVDKNNTKTYWFNINKKVEDNNDNNDNNNNDNNNNNQDNIDKPETENPDNKPSEPIKPDTDLDNNENNQSQQSKNNNGLTIGLTIGFILLSLITIGLSLFFLNKKKKIFKRRK